MAKLQSLNGTTGKETIYVDVDDEITAIIDKVQAAKGKVIALVLPKRAPVLQSIVNMKLLKRTAENADKNLVLITSESGLMPLAGAVGLHVAGTPTSKPSIPSAPALPGDEPEDIEEPLSIVDGNAVEEQGSDFDHKAAAGKSIGELAAAGAAGKIIDDEIDESIDLADDSDDEPDQVASEVTPKPKKDKKLKVPNFDSFRKKIAFGVLGLVVLVVAWIYAFTVLPKATITIHTDTSTVATNLNLTLDTTVKALDATNGIVPAMQQSQQKTETQQVPATGQQNNGTKATGQVQLTAQKCGGNPFVSPSDVPAGTSVTASGQTYILQDSVSFHGTGSSGSCFTYSGGSAGVTALKGGANYNVSNANFAVTGRSDVTGAGSVSGGTDNITKIVQQSDIDNATSKITSADSDSVKTQLVSNIQAKGMLAVPTTFLAGTPQVTTSVQAGATADTVTVTAVTTYTMLAVQKTDIQTLVDANVNNQIDKGKQVILNDGVANANFTEAIPATATGASVSMQTQSVAGPQIDVTGLKKQLAGKKSGDVQSYVKQTPGVTSVDVKFGPFWVGAVPSNPSKTTITIVKAGN